MRLEFPFPSSDLHAHAKGNWQFKYKPTQAARQLAKFICLDMINRNEARPIAGKVLISYAIYVPDNRPRDTCNILQSLKPTIDGIVDSKLIEGDNWQVMTVYNVSVEIDRKNPRVEITLNAVPGNGDMLAK